MISTDVELLLTIAENYTRMASSLEKNSGDDQREWRKQVHALVHATLSGDHDVSDLSTVRALRNPTIPCLMFQDPEE
jgi:hypothetical protein